MLSRYKKIPVFYEIFLYEGSEIYVNKLSRCREELFCLWNYFEAYSSFKTCDSFLLLGILSRVFIRQSFHNCIRQSVTLKFFHEQAGLYSVAPITRLIHSRARGRLWSYTLSRIVRRETQLEGKRRVLARVRVFVRNVPDLFPVKAHVWKTAFFSRTIVGSSIFHRQITVNRYVRYT